MLPLVPRGFASLASGMSSSSDTTLVILDDEGGRNHEVQEDFSPVRSIEFIRKAGHNELSGVSGDEEHTDAVPSDAELYGSDTESKTLDVSALASAADEDDDSEELLTELKSQLLSMRRKLAALETASSAEAERTDALLSGLRDDQLAEAKASSQHSESDGSSSKTGLTSSHLSFHKPFQNLVPQKPGESFSTSNTASTSTEVSTTPSSASRDENTGEPQLLHCRETISTGSFASEVQKMNQRAEVSASLRTPGYRGCLERLALNLEFRVQLESVDEQDVKVPAKIRNRKLVHATLLLWNRHRLCVVLEATSEARRQHQSCETLCLVDAFFLPSKHHTAGHAAMPPIRDLIEQVAHHGSKQSDGGRRLEHFLRAVLDRLEIWDDRQSQLDFLREQHHCQVQVTSDMDESHRRADDEEFQQITCRFIGANNLIISVVLRMTLECPRVPGSVFLESLSWAGGSPSRFYRSRIQEVTTHIQKLQTNFKSPVALVAEVQDLLAASKPSQHRNLHERHPFEL